MEFEKVLAALLPLLQQLVLLASGAILAWTGTAMSDRRTRRRVLEERADLAKLRQFELGRKNAEELLSACRVAWDELANVPMKREDQVVLVNVNPRQIARLGELVPDPLIRSASSAVAALLSYPQRFEEKEAFGSFVLPTGPGGAAPIVVKQILTVETLCDMVAAFLRHEDPSAFSNPLMDLVIVTAGGGMTVRGLYSKE